MKLNVAYAGSFDIFTNGHLWVVQESLKFAHSVLIVVADNSSKKYIFTQKQRVDMIRNVIQDAGLSKRVKIISSVDEYIAIRIKELGITHMIRGIRNGDDFDMEKILQRMNNEISGIQTLFIVPPARLEHVSSSLIKRMMGPLYWTHYLKDLVPHHVMNTLIHNQIRAFLTPYDDKVCMGMVHEKDTFLNYVFNLYDNRPYHNCSHILNMLIASKDYIQSISVHNRIEYVWSVILHDVIMKDNPDYLDNFNMMGVDRDTWDGRTVESKSSCFAHYVSTMYEFHSPEFEQHIVENILATQHTMMSDTKLSEQSKQIVKADLSILYAPLNVFTEYAANIRKEYAEYSNEDYNNGRFDFIMKFLNDIQKNKEIYDIFSIKQIDRIRSNLEYESDMLN